MLGFCLFSGLLQVWGYLTWRAILPAVFQSVITIFILCWCCCTFAKSCPTLCDPMDCRTPGSSVLHYLPEFAQTYVHWVSDAIQPSRLLLAPSPAFNLSEHQGLFQWVSSSHQVAKYWSFSFSISPSNECTEFISFRNDWFDLAV